MVNDLFIERKTGAARVRAWAFRYSRSDAWFCWAVSDDGRRRNVGPAGDVHRTLGEMAEGLLGTDNVVSLPRREVA